MLHETVSSQPMSALESPLGRHLTRTDRWTLASDCSVYDVHRLDGYHSVSKNNDERRRQVCSTHENAFHFVEDNTFDDDR